MHNAFSTLSVINLPNEIIQYPVPTNRRTIAIEPGEK